MDSKGEMSLCHNIDNVKMKSLFTICIEYVSRHIFLVESLENFPDIIGEKIYKQCLTIDCFAENNKASEHAIQLFVNAYGKQFMETLCIRSHKLVNEFSESLGILCLALTRLDLRDCLLGNSNDILKVFGEMNNIKVLNLAHNELSDDGFRSILARHKMYKTGFQDLENLDISENIVSLKVLKSILSLPCLKYVRVSIASSMKSSNATFINTWSEIIKQKRYQVSQVNEEVANGIVNEGWGTKIIQRWENKVDEWEVKRLEKVDKRAQGFYANSLKRAKLNLKRPIIESEIYDTCTYIRSSDNSMLNDISQTPNKNKHCIYNSGSSTSKAGHKATISQNQTTDEEMELLRKYMKR